MTKAKAALALLFLVNVAIWGYAGYATGLARGQGWRGAVLDAGCTSRCLVEAKPAAKL